MSVEWAKRWLPTIFLLLSIFVPWWAFVDSIYYEPREGGGTDAILSFPWEESLSLQYIPYEKRIDMRAWVRVNEIPRLLFVSVLIIVAGLFGLARNDKTRTLGGLLGIAGVLSYFILVFSISAELLKWRSWATGLNPYFGMNVIDEGRWGLHTFIWFLSPGFYLALAGSIMLLLPTIRTLVERLRKRL